VLRLYCKVALVTVGDMPVYEGDFEMIRVGCDREESF
jgi:hypothetical protein